MPNNGRGRWCPMFLCVSGNEPCSHAISSTIQVELRNIIKLNSFKDRYGETRDGMPSIQLFALELHLLGYECLKTEYLKILSVNRNRGLS
ncbi:hypothetical protein TNCT_31791 [Trichonephila clavata]|uniref:Uncharacterized protein n=1 Tax=Trichonephila clavata TaxID=2740835 RepID=A0A8X6IWC5_TRICU|nr:hypothetical protein TNCT_31791 [Trichonephila clavata]